MHGQGGLAVAGIAADHHHVPKLYVAAFIQTASRAYGFQVIFIDYIQLVAPEKSSGGTRSEQVAAISRTTPMLSVTTENVCLPPSKRSTQSNNKGGVGKTVTAINLADILVRDYHKRVVLADCDGQVNMTRFFLPEFNPEDGGTVAEVLTGTLCRRVLCPWGRGERVEESCPHPAPAGRIPLGPAW